MDHTGLVLFVTGFIGVVFFGGLMFAMWWNEFNDKDGGN